MRRAIDICMTVLLLLLMAYQVTGEALHEWIGIGMTVLVIAHITLNRRWYGALVLLENLLMLIFWAFTGDQMAEICRKASPAKKEQKTDNDGRMIHVIFIVTAIMIGMILNLALPGGGTGSKYTFV